MVALLVVRCGGHETYRSKYGDPFQFYLPFIVPHFSTQVPLFHFGRIKYFAGKLHSNLMTMRQRQESTENETRDREGTFPVHFQRSNGHIFLPNHKTVASRPLILLVVVPQPWNTRLALHEEALRLG